MITVDIYVPILDEIYEFRLDETVPVALLAREIGEMICEKEQCQMVGDSKKMVLIDKKGEQIISLEKSLAEAGISTGTRLIFV